MRKYSLACMAYMYMVYLPKPGISTTLSEAVVCMNQNKQVSDDVTSTSSKILDSNQL